jgi:hypothetical protein
MTAGLAFALVAACCAGHPARVAGQNPKGATAIEGIPVELEGELDVLYEDDVTGGRLRHFLIDHDRRIPLLFDDGAAPDLPTGTRVRVKGRMKIDGNLAQSGITPTSITPMDSTAARTMGARDALVILFNFSNNPTQPYSRATAAAVNEQVRRLYLENSFGQRAMNFTVTGWFTIPATNEGCDYYTWATQAEAAASAAGYNIAAYERRIFAFPDASSCTWWSMDNLARRRSWRNDTYGLRIVEQERNP